MAVTYHLFLEPEVHALRLTLPGNVRQRVRRIIQGFTADPRPARSKSLVLQEGELPAGVEVRRLRLEQWQILYAIHDEDSWVWVLAIRRRPPYEYEDLAELVGRLPA